MVRSGACMGESLSRRGRDRKVRQTRWILASAPRSAHSPGPRRAQSTSCPAHHCFSGEHMQGKVTLEDHFAIDETLGDSQPFGPHVWPELRYRLLGFHDPPLRPLDQSGVGIMIAPLTAPAIQAVPDPKRAAEVARRANDVLAAEL